MSVSEKLARLGLEFHCSNRKLLVRDYVSHTSTTGLGRAGDGDRAERRLDCDDLIRYGERDTAVHVETVDHVLISVDKQHLVGGLFNHDPDHSPVGVSRWLPERRQAIDPTCELFADVIMSRVANSRNCVFRLHGGIEGIVDSDNAVDAAVAEHDLLSDLGRAVERPENRIGFGVTELEPWHLCEFTSRVCEDGAA